MIGEKIRFLGIFISCHKIKATQKRTKPKLRSFLGLCT